MNNSTSHVLIIVEDPDLRRALVEIFESEGFEVHEETEGDASVAQVLARNPAVIIMSELIPPLDGLELLPLLRRLTTAPIVVIGEGGETAIVNALLQGADVYMRQPVNFRELLSRVRALLRRSEMDANSYSFLTWPPTRHPAAHFAPLFSSLSAFKVRLLYAIDSLRRSSPGHLGETDCTPAYRGISALRFQLPLLWHATGNSLPLLTAMKGNLW